MILNDVRAILSTYFMSVWDATDIAWPNEKPLEPQGEAWIRFSLVPYSWAVPLAVSPVRRRILSGDIVLQVFVPAGAGAGLAAQLADEAASSFSLFTHENVFCYEAREPVIRGDDGHGWYQIDVAIPFRANPTPV